MNQCTDGAKEGHGTQKNSKGYGFTKKQINTEIYQGIWIHTEMEPQNDGYIQKQREEYGQKWINMDLRK